MLIDHQVGTQGWVRYQFKTPYRDGTMHVLLEPHDFIARLVALVPKPRVNLTRYHGVFAPNSRLRGVITPGKRGGRAGVLDSAEPETGIGRRAAMSWAQRLRRVFNIDIETCERCAGRVKVIASIEDPQVIEKILAHLEKTEPGRVSSRCRERPQPRASPVLPD